MKKTYKVQIDVTMGGNLYIEAETEEEAYCLSKNSVKNAENMIFAAYYADKLKATDKMWILIPKTFQEMCFSKNHQQRMKNNFLRSFKGIYVND